MIVPQYAPKKDRNTDLQSSSMKSYNKNSFKIKNNRNSRTKFQSCINAIENVKPNTKL